MVWTATFAMPGTNVRSWRNVLVLIDETDGNIPHLEQKFVRRGRILRALSLA